MKYIHSLCQVLFGVARVESESDHMVVEVVLPPWALELQGSYKAGGLRPPTRQAFGILPSPKQGCLRGCVGAVTSSCDAILYIEVYLKRGRTCSVCATSKGGLELHSKEVWLPRPAVLVFTALFVECHKRHLANTPVARAVYEVHLVNLRAAYLQGCPACYACSFVGKGGFSRSCLSL